MALLARKFLWLLVFIGVLIATARIDFYYAISERYRNLPLIFKLAGVFDVFPDGESIMDFKNWVMIHLIILIAITPFSLIRVSIKAIIDRNRSLMSISEKMLLCYIKITSIAIFLMIVLNLLMNI